MAGIDITSGIAAAYGAGELQLQGKVQMTSTLTPVTDNLNVASPLLLSTTGVQITSPLRITTSDASGFYLDAEDAATNNRFSIKRDPSSQQVTLDFASNPSGSTTPVGAIRTFRDGTNLSEAMTFIEDGSIGVGTTAPVGLLDLFKAAAATRLAIRGDAGQNRLISYRTGALQRFGLYVNNTAESGANAGSNFAIRAYNDAGTLLSTPLFIQRSTGNVGIGTTAPQNHIVPGLVIGDGTDNKGITLFGTSITQQNIVFTDTANAKQGLIQYDHAGDYMRIQTNSIEQMRITSAGNVLISATAPVGSRNELRLGGNAGGSAITMGRLGSNVFTIQNDSGDNVYLENTANTFMSFSTNNVERIRILAAGGLTFNGDTAAANALDDYEEGTWTPTDASGAGLTLTSALGSYTKIGREVFYRAFIQYPLTVDVSNATIGGLPFTTANNNDARTGNVNYTDETTLFYALTNNNNTIIPLYNNAGASITNAHMSTNVLFIGGNYIL